ncbi:MAG: DNA polymerase III subunit [Fimbriimonadales bacterium]
MRPLPFREVVLAPESVRHALARMLMQPSPPQSLLLVGMAGVGKRTLARSLTAAWMCPQRTAEGHCGACPVCEKWSEAGEHPDLRVLRPDPDQIKIDSVRSVRQWASFAPAVAPVRFVLLEEAHLLNPAAANALLKTLEEPPPNYHFLLTAPASDLLLQTILSRCRIVRLGTLPKAQVMAHLSTRYTLSEATLQTIAAFSDGALGRAIRWADALQAAGDAPRELDALQSLLGVFARLGQASLEDALRLAHEFREACKALEGGSQARSARAALALGLEYLILWYRDALALQYPNAAVRFEAHRDALRQLATRFHPAEHTQDMGAIIEARRALLGNANAQIVTESLFVRLLAVA